MCARTVSYAHARAHVYAIGVHASEPMNGSISMYIHTYKCVYMFIYNETIKKQKQHLYIYIYI